MLNVVRGIGTGFLSSLSSLEGESLPTEVYSASFFSSCRLASLSLLDFLEATCLNRKGAKGGQEARERERGSAGGGGVMQGSPLLQGKLRVQVGKVKRGKGKKDARKKQQQQQAARGSESTCFGTGLDGSHTLGVLGPGICVCVCVYMCVGFHTGTTRGSSSSLRFTAQPLSASPRREGLEMGEGFVTEVDLPGPLALWATLLGCLIPKYRLPVVRRVEPPLASGPEW